MPKCIYVRLRGCNDVFLVPTAGAAQPGVSYLEGALAVQPTSPPWQFKINAMQNATSASRTQCPLLPQKQCIFDGVQGKTTHTGFIAQ